MLKLTFNLNVRSVGIAIAVLAVGAFLPSRAVADCGDYVHIESAVEGKAQPAPMPKPPCDGPHCSQRPGVPPAPLTVPLSETEIHKSIAETLGFDSASGSVRTLRIARSILALPDPVSSSIFHPPRSF